MFRASADFQIRRFDMKVIAASAFLAGLTVLIVDSAFAQQVMSSEPPPGQLGAGQVVYVACGPGKARKVTGGNNMGRHGMVGQGAGRTRGPCLPMKQ
jgi:hypothetical protein